MELAIRLSGYCITEQLYVGDRTLVYRGVREHDQLPVVIKLLRNPFPSFNELLQFRNQYKITKDLDLSHVVKPLAIEPYENAYALVMEDFGGISLKQALSERGKGMAGNSQALTEFLRIAIQLADALDGLSRHRIIHKDLKPANILIHPDDQQIKLIDFSIASLLPRETQAIQSPNILEGTLAYLSPEQTGRMNRGIDYRSDFYSLGVTFYKLLTGALPFSSDNPVELVHCHLARQPTPVHLVVSEIPIAISEIVNRLMAKNAEDRYQSAVGLKHDLEKCLSQLQVTGQIKLFALGQQDYTDRFLVSEKLYGRASEVRALLAAFDRISLGSSEMMLVAGFSGIGKTAVVNEVHKPIVRQRGYFIKGKYDQFQRNIPLSALVQAFCDLIAQLLSEPDSQLKQWQQKITAAIAEDGQVLIDVIPELETIIGQQPAAAKLSSSAAQNRFNRLFQKFVHVFTTAEHPLVVFLDDLQWADLASLKLLQLLMEDTSHLLIIGAYRDNEVSPIHPLMLTADEIRKTGITVSTIALQPLSRSSLNQLVADTINCDITVAEPLTDLVQQKTKGNPFFARQFLRALHEEGQIAFDWAARCWQCDIAQVRAKALTDNVVEFMALQLQKLPTTTQNILMLSACIGNQFDLQTLAIVSQTSIEETAARLWRALQEGFILPTAEVYKFFAPAKNDLPLLTGDSVTHATYRFLHDRVQQAAYSLITSEHKHETHLRIGRLLLSNLAETDRKKKLLEVVNQLNAGAELMTNQVERNELAQLNLAAGQRARAATAYAAAAEYFAQGINLLAVDRWQNHYSLTLSLYESALEAAYLNNRFEQIPAIAAVVLEQCRSALDSVNTHKIQILAHIAQENPAASVEIGLKALKSLGICFPDSLTPEDLDRTMLETNTLVLDQGISNLIRLPAMTDSTAQAALQIDDNLFTAAYIAAPNLLLVISALGVRLSITYGNAPLSVVAYVQYGALLCSYNEIEVGYQLGQLALTLLSQHEGKEFSTEVLCMFAAFIKPWKVHFRESILLLRQGYEDGLETGALNYAAFNYYHECRLSYLSGQELTSLEAKLVACSQALRQIHQELPLSYTELLHQVVQNLINPVDDPCHLTGEVHNEEQFKQRYQATHNREALCYLFLYKLTLCYRFEKYAQALEYADLATEYLESVPGQIVLPLFYFYDSLSRLTALTTAPNLRADFLERVAANQSKVKQWATFAPMNFQHLYVLVEAERYRVLNNRAEAIEHYDRAIALAHEHQYLGEESLAYELAAKFYLEWGKDAIAQSYMQTAYYAYSRWGAKAKVEDLEQRYPLLLSSVLQQQHQQSSRLTETMIATDHANSQTLTLDSYETSKSLDLATLLKASQTLSSEIELEKLLSTLLKVVIENAGADKCVLLLPKQGQWMIEAISELGKTPIVLQSLPLQLGHNIPVSLINTVKRSLQPSVIFNALTDPLLAVEPYILNRQPRSILCTPILNQGSLIGILYLENSLATGAFTRDRIEVLNLLCTQAAISLENARLYYQAQQAVMTLQSTASQLEYQSNLLRSLIDATSDWIFVKDRDFRFVLVNRGFANAVGKPIQEMIGKNDLELGVPEQFIFGDLTKGIKGFRVDDEKVLAGESVYDPYVPSTDANGDVRVFDTQKLPLRDVNGEVIGVIAICIDITERQQDQIRLRESEAQLRQQAEALQQAFQELQQAQTRLVQSEKMSALGNLVAAVAHEINNPIGFLSGNINPALDYMNDLFGLLDLYQQKYPTPDPEIQEEIATIDLDYVREDLPKLIGSMREGVDRIRNISTSLRTFSRADSDRPVACDIHDGIDSTLLILTHRLKANEMRPGIPVVKDYGEIPLIQCFAGQLNQVFMNVLANAIDAIEESSQGQSYQQIEARLNRISIKTELSDDQASVVIRIQDNGTGMSEAVKQKVFDHLFTTKGIGKGTGLGLAIVHQIVVEKHGGTLEVHSTLGKGTEFMITIPVRADASV